mmetsp:Transcript_45134/g.130644  ORF Transcript_45134/g.130644 Transcript_45134/m.130644 type:complete len:224 (+) Transcript_45134:1159-1830(+)
MLLSQLRVRGRYLSHLLLSPSQLVLQSALVLFVAVDAGSKVVVLRLQGVCLLSELLQPLLYLLLSLQCQLKRLIEHPVLLLEQRLHLCRISCVCLRRELCVHLFLQLFLQVRHLLVQHRNLLLLVYARLLLLLQVHLMLAQLVHQGIDLVAQLAEVVGAGLVLVLHPRVVVLGALQGLPQGLHRLLQRELPPLDLRLALRPLVGVAALHVQLHADALLLHCQL